MCKKRKYWQGLITCYCQNGLRHPAQPVKISCTGQFFLDPGISRIKSAFFLDHTTSSSATISTAQAACCGLVWQSPVLQPLLPPAVPFYLKLSWSQPNYVHMNTHMNVQSWGRSRKGMLHPIREERGKHHLRSSFLAIYEYSRILLSTRPNITLLLISRENVQ